MMLCYVTLCSVMVWCVGAVLIFSRSGCVAQSVEVWLRELASCRSVGPVDPVSRLVGRSVLGVQSVGRPKP